MLRELFRFRGGVHPPEHKTESNARPIHAAPLPRTLTIPLRQHIGNPAKPVVEVGQRVRKGQLIAEPDGMVSAAVHASSSGVVSAIGKFPVPHVSGLPDDCIVIDTDGRDEWAELTPLDPDAPPAELLESLRLLGVAGLGGAVFPTQIKLATHAPCPTLIINGGECEPWITCDDALMRHRADTVLDGVAIMRRLLGSTEVLVGIEDNKPEAIAAMRGAAAKLDFPVEIVAVPAIYPGGGAKQMIETLTGRQVPSGKLSTDIGIQVFNVGTAAALANAVRRGEPLISRLVTVTGFVLKPQNYEVLIGTPFDLLIGLAGERHDASRIVMGGPMMGFAVPNPHVPVVKATNCVLVQSNELFPPQPRALPCIRCTRCADACPASLQPQELFRFAKAQDFGRAQEYHLFDCIECGCCSYVCPSHIPLVDYYRYAKSEIWAKERDKRASDLARERHEFREFRLERDKREKAEKLAAKAATARAKLEDQGQRAEPEGAAQATPADDPKKALIEAAMARAAAKKAEAAPKNVDALTPEQRHQIEEIEARRAKIRELARKPLESEEHR